MKIKIKKVTLQNAIIDEDDAKKKADEYIDDEHYRTKASTGDVCMLFIVDELKI